MSNDGGTPTGTSAHSQRKAATVYRALLIASHEWDRPLVTLAVLTGLHDEHPDLCLIHRGNPGPDRDASAWCVRHGIPQEVYPLDGAPTKTEPDRDRQIIDAKVDLVCGLLMPHDLAGMAAVDRMVQAGIPIDIEWYHRVTSKFRRLASSAYIPPTARPRDLVSSAA